MSVLNGVLSGLLATLSLGLSDTAGGDRKGLGMSLEEEERGRLWKQEHLRIYEQSGQDRDRDIH